MSNFTICGCGCGCGYFISVFADADADADTFTYLPCYIDYLKNTYFSMSIAQSPFLIFFSY